MKHMIENFYLNEKNNKIIITVMLMNAVICILVGYNKINIVVGYVATFLTLAGVSINSIRESSVYKK